MRGGTSAIVIARSNQTGSSSLHDYSDDTGIIIMNMNCVDNHHHNLNDIDDDIDDAILPFPKNPNDEISLGTKLPPPSPPQQQQVHIHYRIRLTILHYLLTYPQWSIALFMYLANITTVHQLDSLHAVSDTWYNLQDMIQNESKFYTTCVHDGYTHYQQNINIELQKELQRIQQYRTNVLQPYIEHQMIPTTNQCINTSQAALRALQTWDNTLKQIIPIHPVPSVSGTVVAQTNTTNTGASNKTKQENDDDNNNKCTFLDHQMLLDMIANDVNMVQSNIQDIVNQYMTESLHSINTLVQYSHDRSMYDYNYFIGIKIQSTIQLLDQFVLTISPHWNITTIQLQWTLEVRKLLQDILDAIYSAHLQINVLTLRLQEFETSINALYLNYMNLYVRFDSIQTFVADFLPRGIALPNYFDISDLPLPHTLLPVDFFHNPIPNFNTNLPNIEGLTNTFIDKTLQLLSTILLEIANDITYQAQYSVHQFIELLRSRMQLNDYHPPKYPIPNNTNSAVRTLPNDEMNYISRLSETTQSDLTRAFNALQQHHYYSSDAPITMDPNVSFSNNNWTVRNDTNLHQFPLLDILYPTNEFHFIPHWLITIILFIWSQSFMIECITQAYRLRQVKRKYEQEATPDLPNIDYVVEENTTNDDDHETTWTYRMNRLRNIVLPHIMNPWVVVGIVLLPFVLILFVFWFPHVKESCIDSRRGTFIARNIWKPININRANSPGRIHHNVQQIQCYNRQRYICHTQMMISDSIYRSDMNTLFTLQTRYNESKSIRDVIRKCVDTNVLDGLFHLHCCGLEDYDIPENCQTEQQWKLCPIDTQIDPPASFRPVTEALAETTCNVYPTLNDHMETAYFNCSTIEQTCSHVPCTGVDENLITLWTIEADCIIEVYAIQVCIFIAIVVYHAIMINLINRLLFHGILQIQWQRLKPDGITLITSIDNDGHLTKGADPQERAELIHRVMKQYVRTGYLQVGLGISVFFVWIITTFVIRHAASHVAIYHK